MALAVSEAATNAVLHGTRGDDPCITVRVDTSRGEVFVTVCDDGHGMKARTDSPGAGLGLPVIATVSKALRVVSSNEGTEIHMTFPCPNAVAA